MNDTLHQEGWIARMRGRRRWPPRLAHPDDAYAWLRGWDDAETDTQASAIRSAIDPSAIVGKTHVGNMVASMDKEKIG